MAIANVEQAAAWDGEEGARWAANAARYESTSRHLWRSFLEAVEIAPDADVLDIGCGSGGSALDAARAASRGSVLGVDLSSEMLAVARERAEQQGLRNVRFEQADVQVHPFESASADLAISSFGVMFFNDPVSAFTNVARTLRPGGSAALLVWREFALNRWVYELREALAFGREFPDPPRDAPGPFGFADPDRVRAILEPAGFRGITFDPIDEPFEPGSDLEEAFAFVRTFGIVHGLSAGLEQAQLDAIDDAIRDLLARYETPDGVRLPAAAWVIRASRS